MTSPGWNINSFDTPDGKPVVEFTDTAGTQLITQAPSTIGNLSSAPTSILGHSVPPIKIATPPPPPNKAQLFAAAVSAAAKKVADKIFKGPNKAASSGNKSSDSGNKGIQGTKTK